MCANVHYESVYFKELHNDQETEYYWLTIYPAGAAVVSTITSLHFEEYLQEKPVFITLSWNCAEK